MIRRGHLGVLSVLMMLAGTANAEPAADAPLLEQLQALVPGPAVPMGPVAGAAEAFEHLIGQLPDQRPSGRPVGEVALLGVRRPSGWQGVVQSWLMPKTVLLDRLEADLLAALQRRRPEAILISPGGRTGTASALLDFSADRSAIAATNAGLGLDALLAVQVSQTWDWPGSVVVDARLYGGRSDAGAFEYASSAELPDAVAGYGVWNWRAGLVALAVLIVVLVRRTGKGGVLVVDVREQGEEETDAAVHVVYTAYIGRDKIRDDADAKNVIMRRRVYTGETEMKRLPTQEVCVAVRRVERRNNDHQVLSNEMVEKTVRLGRGRRVRVPFDFGSKGTSLEVRLVQADGEVATAPASLALESQPQSARYVRDGVVSVSLPPGAHTLLVGYADRAFRVPVRIQAKTREASVEVDVDNVEKAFFNGCPDAVTPYVGGDLAAAAVALESTGQSAPAALLRAAVLHAKGDTNEAAQVLESAGQLREAARVRASAGDAAGTAVLLEQAEDWRGAARQHRVAGDLVAAARAFARGEYWDEALECAFETGERSVAIEVLELKRDYMRAAQICLEDDDEGRAVVLLQRVPMADPQYGESCLLLAEMFNGREEPELALQKLDEAVGVFGSETSLELREQIGLQLEAKGNMALALECFEHIRKRDINYPGAGDKIEKLRARLTSPPAEKTVMRAGASGAAPPPQSDSSRYEIEAEIGRGGMGIVYRARDSVLGRVVAYKRLPDNLIKHKEAVKFFLREARSAAALNHPNIVTLYDAGQDGDIYYITMELLEGRPINEVLQKMKRLDVKNTMKIAIQVAEGLAYAHEQSIVHRDIKPSNLFLTKNSRIKIMDFGLAKMVEEVRRKTTLIAGTPHYMAPEQAIGEQVDQRADLYAFGVTIYELLVGEVPFPKGDAAHHRLHTPPPDIRSELPDTPVELAELIIALMAKQPNDRPSTADVTLQLKTILRSLG